MPEQVAREMVTKFVDMVNKMIAEEEFKDMCRQARDGGMGFSKVDHEDWGPPEDLTKG